MADEGRADQVSGGKGGKDLDERLKRKLVEGGHGGERWGRAELVGMRGSEEVDCG